jgi:2-C-methyl-D-erythritol 4-phosphate cytidylyltransferase
MKKIALIVAGGTGTRMESPVPKQFMLLGGKPVLYYSLKTFLDTFEDIQVILVLPMSYTDMGQEIIDAFFDKDRIRITAGGDTRFQSVKNGLQLIEEESIIFVHDAVRCLVTPALLERCYEQAVETGSAIPVVPSRDSVRILREDTHDAIDRNRVMLVQTPQAFHSKILIPAYQIDYKDKFTDEAAVVEAYGLKVSLVLGEETNLKITHPTDMLVAAEILKRRAAAVM